MSGDNSWASVEGRYYRAVLGVSEPICEVGLHSHLYKYLGREAFAHPHTFSFLHQWSLQWAFYTRGTCCSCSFELGVISNCSAFVGICPLSFHCWGDGLGTGVLSAGETQWQVYEHTCNSFGGWGGKTTFLMINLYIFWSPGTQRSWCRLTLFFQTRMRWVTWSFSRTTRCSHWRGSPRTQTAW